jgi:hypothetical protein
MNTKRLISKSPEIILGERINQDNEEQVELGIEPRT